MSLPVELLQEIVKYLLPDAILVPTTPTPLSAIDLDELQGDNATEPGALDPNNPATYRYSNLDGRFTHRHPLYSLCLSSRLLNIVSTPYMYTSIQLHDVRGILLFSTTVANNPTYAGHIRHLNLTVTGLQTPDIFRDENERVREECIAAVTRSEDELRDHSRPWRNSQGTWKFCQRLLFGLLFASKEIRSLVLRISQVGDHRILFDTMKKARTQDLPMLEKLDKLHIFVVDNTAGFGGRLDKLDCYLEDWAKVFLECSKVKQLELAPKIMYPTNMTVGLGSSVDSLHLHSTICGRRAIYNICRNLSKLRRLRIDSKPPRGQNLDIGLYLNLPALRWTNAPQDEINTSLLLLAPTLEHLDLRMHYRNLSPLDPWFPPASRITCLDALGCLKWVCIEPPELADFSTLEASPQWHNDEGFLRKFTRF